MKILLLTANFAAPNVTPWLLDDLTVALSRAGHTVDVIVHSPTAPRPRGKGGSPAPRVTVWSVGLASPGPLGSMSKLVSYITTGVRLHTVGWRVARRSSYDLCIYTSIAAFSYGFPARIRRKRIATKLLFIMWDYFPIHQLEIGRIRSKWLHRPLKMLEWLSIRDSDIITTMSPANKRFLNAYHKRLSALQIMLPPWASSDEFHAPAADSGSDFTAVFGGQLVKGRGLETLLRAMKLLQDENEKVRLIIAGDGPDRAKLVAKANEYALANVVFAGALPRPEYRELIATAHSGIAITVPGVTPPTFPSKIVEYCASGLPVLVCVEPSSDAGALIERHGAGISVAAGDPRALARGLAELAAEHRSGELRSRAASARALFVDELSVEKAVDRIAQAVIMAGGHSKGSVI